MYFRKAADLITLTRSSTALIFAFLGIKYGAQALTLVVWLMLLVWVGDAIDGPLARRSRSGETSWIGEHDLEVDLLISGGLLFYLSASGFLHVLLAGGYFLVWLLIYLRWRFLRSPSRIVQLPIYAWFVWVARVEFVNFSSLILVWSAATALIAWPRFRGRIFPDFIHLIQGISREFCQRPASNSRKEPK